MTKKYTFADRYAEAGISPSADLINSRQEPVVRIVNNINNTQILDLVAVYYGDSNTDLDWFRDEFIKEDASFSLVNNERETRVLAALVLSKLVDNNMSVAMLALSTGGFRGKRAPSQSSWLLKDAEEAISQYSVNERRPAEINTKVTPTITAKLQDEVALLANTNDWAALILILEKIRAESKMSAQTTAQQITKALTELNLQTEFMREESQMLWWLIGGHSRTFERSFTTFGQQQAALIGAVDLSILTTQSMCGPIAIPAMLERVIASAKKIKGVSSQKLATAIDGFDIEDLKLVEVSTTLSPIITPITSAIEMARTMGLGAWHSTFKSRAKLDSSIELDHTSMAEQLYRECLLGQFL